MSNMAENVSRVMRLVVLRSRTCDAYASGARSIFELARSSLNKPAEEVIQQMLLTRDCKEQPDSLNHPRRAKPFLHPSRISHPTPAPARAPSTPPQCQRHILPTRETSAVFPPQETPVVRPLDSPRPILPPRTSPAPHPALHFFPFPSPFPSPSSTSSSSYRPGRFAFALPDLLARPAVGGDGPTALPGKRLGGGRGSGHQHMRMHSRCGT